MRDEYDFSQAERGKFFNPNASFSVPIYLDEESMKFVKSIAEKKKLDISKVVNELLHSDKHIAEFSQ